MTTATGLALEPGDRVPNFILPNHEGTQVMFYNKTQGGPVVLLIAGEGDDAARETGAFVDRWAAFRDHAAELFVIARAAAAPPPPGAGILFLNDPLGKITASLAGAVRGEAGDATPPLALLLDHNQRLLGVATRTRRPLVETALDLLASRLPDCEALAISTTAPVLTLPNMLDAETRQSLIDLWETQGHREGDVFAVKDGRPTRGIDFSKKKRQDHTIFDDALQNRLMAKIGPRIAEEVFKAFTCSGFGFERLVIGAYDDQRGDYFRPHRDNLNPNTAGRRFAVSINLNDDYEGGELCFPEYGPHLYRAPAGGAVIFSCALIHEALPVHRGRRFVLLGFLRDPENRPHPWSVRLG